MHIHTLGAASGYVHHPQFHKLSTLTMNIHNHRKNMDVKALKDNKGEPEAATREGAKTAQREVSKI
jgi:hypothetical protein